MGSVQSTFKVRRLALIGNTPVPVFPPGGACAAVQIINLTPGDLRVYTEDSADDTKYFAIVAGYDHSIPAYNVNFSAREVAFYLKPDVDGTVVLIWV